MNESMNKWMNESMNDIFITVSIYITGIGEV